MPQISVIIPTFNRADFVLKAVESVLTQTYSDFELLVIDDGSNDKTKQIVSALSDSRLAYLYQQHKGVSAARNLGIQKSHGAWLCFLDSDDYWLPKKLEAQIAFTQSHPDILIHQTDEMWIRNGTRVNPMKKHTKYSGMIYERCLPLCCITPSSVIIHRSVFNEVGMFDETMPACEDYDLWLRITYAYPVGLIKEKLIVKHGGHDDQLSRTVSSLDKYRIEAMIKMLKRNILSPEQKTATIHELRKKCTIYGNGCLKHKNYDEGRNFLSLAGKKW